LSFRSLRFRKETIYLVFGFGNDIDSTVTPLTFNLLICVYGDGLSLVAIQNHVFDLGKIDDLRGIVVQSYSSYFTDRLALARGMIKRPVSVIFLDLPLHTPLCIRRVLALTS